MVKLNDDILKRTQDALKCLSRLAPVRAAYVFGSQARGDSHAHSDIDLAVFLDGAEEWDMRRKAKASSEVQKICGEDIEVHLFPSSASHNPPPGSFADHVMNTGQRLLTEAT
ncbi:MAG: hypothetical protein GC164_07105 [Phycisphaera sp.]|nr:hypothetical protein [Phycisphaera sp.]